MPPRARVASFLALPLLIPACQGPTTDAAATRPNVILFLVDDMGWQDTSVPFWTETTAFNRHFRTPAMQRLAALGVRFTHAYSHAVCSPTRTSIMTGQNPARHRVTNWTLHPDRDTSGKWGRVGPPTGWRQAGLQPADRPLAVRLRDAGYRTIFCGKAHWGAIGTPGSDPRNLGFDVNIAGHSAGGPGSYQGTKNYGNKLGEHTLPWGVPGLEKYHGSEVHLTDALTAEAKAAVADAVRDDQPFFLYMAHYAVHAPIQPHTRFLARYQKATYPGTDQKIPVPEQRYASMVEGMDRSLHDLLEQVERLGVSRQTLVIFTSDNGGLSAHARARTPRGTGNNTHNWPLRAGKGSAYEGGTRVPYIVAWAQADAGEPLQAALPLRAGTTSTQPLLCEDLFPTILGVCGATPVTAQHLDGRDARPYWTGAASDPDRVLLFHYPHVWGPRGPGYEPHSALRRGRFKVIYFYNSRRWELYDLVADIGEQHDLSKLQPDRLQRMALLLRSELHRHGAQWPVDRRTGADDIPVVPD